MNFRPRNKGRGLIINITTLIDVMFLLLIFFMVTSTFKNPPAIYLVLPRSATASETVDTPAILFLTSEGDVYLNDTLIDLVSLGARLKEMHDEKGEDRMVLRADEDAAHGDVVKLSDTNQQSGLTRVSLSARVPAAN